MAKELAMCYLVRQQQAGAEHGSALPPGSGNSIRPRWVGAATAALVGGLALAALVAPTSMAPQLEAKPATAAPVAARAMGAAPTIPVLEQTSTSLDDGVPGAAEVAKSGAGNCHHGL
jgi:hypothetical protein